MNAQPSRDDFNRDCDRDPKGAFPMPRAYEVDGAEIARKLLERESWNLIHQMEKNNELRIARGEKPIPIHYPAIDNGQRRRRSDQENAGKESADPVNKPTHYRSHPSGIECIQVTEHMGFNLGNAVKYIWRCDLKADAIEDLKKAVWYINREISKREGAAQ